MPQTDDLYKYDDIIHLPHHSSAVHRRMPILDRAAQFAPFAALAGYGDAVKETARLTDARMELSDDEKDFLDARLASVACRLAVQPQITVTYFEADGKKEGGAYRTHAGAVKKIDFTKCTLLFSDGVRIPLPDILRLEDGIREAGNDSTTCFYGEP